MNSLFIIAHAPLAHALRQCALHVYPDCADFVAALDVQPNVSPDETLAAARITMHQVGNAPGIKGLLVLTDVFGATPCNVAQKLVDGVTSKLVCGVNLPMLLRTLSYRHEALEALVTRAVTGGTQGVMQVNITAPQNQALRNFGKHDQDQYFHQQ
ncbi:MAG: PTS sugar transporter subunit IIA [Burkholderiaceae bacterium]